MLTGRFALVSGAILGFMGVALGAFGAHALKPMLEQSGRLDTFELAVRYQFFHAFALLATGILHNMKTVPAFRYAGVLFFYGTLLFSGSLYVLCFSGLGALGMITPIGGVLMLAGWILLCIGILKR